MYNSSETSTRIRQLAKEKGIQMSELQEKCGLSKNTIVQSGKSQEGMKAKNLYAISEILDCSVDYLLGRTDNPNLTGGAYINGDNNNNGQQSINGNVTVNSSDDSSDTSDDKQLLDMIKELDIVDRSKIIIQIDEMKNKKTSPMSGAN